MGGGSMQTDSRFHHWALVLDPVPGALLVLVEGACLEALDVALQHG